MFPNLQLLAKVSKEIRSIPNKKKESKRGVHYGLFLLGYQSGLRVSEAVGFDLSAKNKQGLYRIEKPKGKKERLVYIPKKVIRELKKHNWQPNSTNRHNFYHFLKKVKRELNISESVELTPHTLRRAFATYHAESGLPLPLLQKQLGHSSIRTTALYWKNIYQEPGNDIGSVLATKNWLEKKKPRITENFVPLNKTITGYLFKNRTIINNLNNYLFPKLLETSKPIFTDQQPVISHKKPTRQDNSPSAKKTATKTPGMSINKIPPNTPAKFFLINPSKKTDQLKTSQLSALTANQEPQPTKKETILLQKINHLERQLRKTITERDNLKIAKEQEKQRADQTEQQLRKISYYQQLEQEQNQIQRAQIIQPPPLKVK